MVSYANRGMALEELLQFVNQIYDKQKIAVVQKISTPWKVIRKGKQIITAFPEGKSTLDFRGTVKGGLSISFDAKESQNERGLPLAYIKQHQIDYMEKALEIGECTFLICYIKPVNKFFFIDGKTAVEKYNYWKLHKGKRGCNLIPKEIMTEIKPVVGNPCPYLDYINNKEIVI